MFYSLNILIPHHGGKFSDPWLAATRGINHIPRNKIIASNIVQICADIVLMIETSSNRPSLRLSLSLSSRLINGTVKIHRRQVEIIMEEIIEFLAHVQKPQSILEITEIQQGTPDSPIPRVQRKRKRSVKLTQENELEVFTHNDLLNMEPVLEVSERNQADVDLITLRESLVTDTPRYDVACGELGIFPDSEPLIQDVPLSSVQPTEDKGSKRIAEEDQPQTSSKRKKTSACMSTKTVTAPDIQLLPPEVEQENLIQALIDNEQENNLEGEISTVQEQILSLVLPETENIERKRDRKPKVNKVNISIQRAPRFININKEDEYNTFLFKADNRQKLDKFMPLEDVDIISLVAEFMEGTHEIEKILAASPGVRSSLVSSLNLGHPHRRGSKRSRSGTPMPPLAEDEANAEIASQILVSVEVHAPHTPEVAAPVQQSIGETSKEILTPLVESTAINIPVLEDVIKPYTVEVAAPTGVGKDLACAKKVLPFTSNDDDGLRKNVRKNRQKRIQKIVESWTEGDIMIEDVCSTPINRYNLAATFGDLLYLQALGCVKLNNKSNSLELRSIEKGPKIKSLNLSFLIM